MKAISRIAGPATAAWLLLGPAVAVQVPLVAAQEDSAPELQQPASGEAVSFRRAVEGLADADIILMGEHHNHRADHRAQAQLVHGLLTRKRVVVGMEPFPRSSNPALERWRQGEHADFRDFLKDSGWYRHWGMSAELYRPVLEAVRLNRLPLVGMNIPRQWVRQVAREGLGALSEEARETIGEVAPPNEAYRQMLGEHFRSHRQAEGKRETSAGELSGFAAAQAVWDAAMAEALMRAKREHPEAVVVGLVGSGHLRKGLGIQRQIRARKEGLEVATVLPYDPGQGQSRPGPEGVDLAWRIPAEPAAPAARLGVAIDRQAEGKGLLVREVTSGSSAERAGVEAGDRLVGLDARELRHFTDLIHLVKRHHWGGCLRLTLIREGEEETLNVPLAPADMEGVQVGPSHGNR